MIHATVHLSDSFTGHTLTRRVRKSIRTSKRTIGSFSIDRRDFSTYNEKIITGRVT